MEWESEKKDHRNALRALVAEKLCYDAFACNYIWCRCCDASPELPLRLFVDFALAIEKMAGSNLATAVATGFHQSLVALASPDMFDISTINKWRSISLNPRRFGNNSPRNPCSTFSGRSRSFFSGSSSYIFHGPAIPPPRPACTKSSANPATASAATGKNIQHLQKKDWYPQAEIQYRPCFFITNHTKDTNEFNLKTINYNIVRRVWISTIVSPWNPFCTVLG